MHRRGVRPASDGLADRLLSWEPERLPSWALVAVQFGALALLIVTTTPAGGAARFAFAAGLVALGAAIGIAALAANRPGNFNIRPEVRPGARLVTHGIYRHCRHPMYLALLVAAPAPLLVDPRGWRFLAYLALATALHFKANREERGLLARFPEYAAYRARTRKLVPLVF